MPRYTVNTATINNNVDVTNNNNQAINNAIDASASTGDASVSGNTSAGNATTGAAKTNLTVFNLTGANVVASNDLLVFVNVLGTWYGMILNAPAGTTAASLGGGVSSNTTVNNATLNNTANQSINNNIKVSSKTGDASVSGNTSAGNAKSGDATSSVNLMNMIDDSLSLNGWFGLLFINVFGTWNGSFGVNTSAGDPVVTPTTADGNSGQMFQFVPKAGDFNGTGGTFTSFGSYVGGSGDGSSSNLSQAAVLAAKTVTGHGDNTPAITKGAHANYLLPILGSCLALIILLAGERQRFFHRG